MKTKYILLIAFLCCSAIGFSQNKLFDKYADMDDVSSVYISKAMFQMMPTIESTGLSLANMQGKIESLQILRTQNKAKKEQMNREFRSLVGKQHEELMRVKDGKTKANFYILKKGDRINELIMIADTEADFSVIQLLGNFTLKDIQEITKDTK